MQHTLFYPAIFHTAEEGGFWITFPDIPECITEGDTLEQAYNMASDALGLALSDRLNNQEDIPAASLPADIQCDDGFIVIISFDLLAYNKRTKSRAVKKTLSIPEWMNEEAIALNINFSQVLQDALLQKIQSN